jgi:cytochrome P450
MVTSRQGGPLVPALTIPECDVDLFDDEVLRDPYPTYAQLRSMGPVVRLPEHGFLAVARYADVRAVLNDHEHFVSGTGVGFNEEFNHVRSSSIIASDPPRHEMLRDVLGERLGPRALKGVEDVIRGRAAELVAEVVRQESFDAVKDFGEVFPVQVVGELIGLPVDSRSQLLRWANGAFNAFGPPGERTSAGLTDIAEQFEYIRTVATRDQLAPGSMGAAVYEAADRGLIPEEYCLPLLSAYLTAGMDTTVNALSAMIWLLGTHPDSWRELRENPRLAPSVINEVLRLEAPAQLFARMAVEGAQVAGVPIEAGERVAVVYASANRDENQYPDPDRFDIRRNPAGHLTFGSGLHVCAGQHLAKIELRAVLDTLIAQVDEITVGDPVRKVNNVLRGLANLPASFTTRGQS